MPSPRSRVGQSAEIVAAAELGKQGYSILASNYRCKQGEIDFIAKDGDSIVFVEVRCRRTTNYGSPAESITSAKQEKIIATAQHYLNEQSMHDVNCRFDVVEVVSMDGRLCVQDIIKDAFWL